MSRQQAVWLLFSLWAALYALSVWQFLTLPPTGDSFVRGMNRVLALLGWQAAAAGVALALWLTGRGIQADAATRWLSRVPVLLALALAVGLAMLLLWARLRDPVPEDAPTTARPAPVTHPVTRD